MFSWMIDFVLSSIPSWFWLVGAGVSLAVFFLSGILSHIPTISMYAKFLKPVAGIITLACVFMYGGAGVQALWEEKVRVAQEIADRKAKESEEFSKKLDEERKKKQKVRVEYYNTVKTEIKEVEKIINSKCEIDPKVPELLNKAARNPAGENK
jgi:hypothetical protein